MRYAEVKPDLSGSRTKNRYRIEVLWGLDRLLEMVRQEGDFAVVFDYLCDVEVHSDESIEFHQVKTKKSGGFSYSWLCVPKKGTSGNKESVLLTLYKLKEVEEAGKVTNLMLVANGPLSINREGVAPEPGVYSFTGFPDTVKNKICEALAVQLKLTPDEIDLENVFYRYEELPLEGRMKEAVQGKLVSVFNEVTGAECERPSAMFRALEDLAQDRASVVKEFSELDEVIAAKGITRNELEKVFDQHHQRSDRAVERACEWVEGLPVISQFGLKKAIAEVAQTRSRSTLWEKVLSVANGVISGEMAPKDETEAIDYIAMSCPCLSGIEMQGALKKAWAAVALFHCLEESS